MPQEVSFTQFLREALAAQDMRRARTPCREKVPSPLVSSDVPAGIVLTNDGNAILREIDVSHPAAKVKAHTFWLRSKYDIPRWTFDGFE